MSKPNNSLGEKIYDFPFLYKLKIDILNKINNLDVNFNKLIENRKVLDIGCGSYQTRYDTNLPKIRVGIDLSVDVSLLLYVLHHIPKNRWKKVLKEAVRVTKNKIIIFDHIRNNNPFLACLQMLYWNTFDGGDHYATEQEWQDILKNFNIKSYKRLGKLFDHICYYEISLK